MHAWYGLVITTMQMHNMCLCIPFCLRFVLLFDVRVFLVISDGLFVASSWLYLHAEGMHCTQSMSMRVAKYRALIYLLERFHSIVQLC